jgi:hypothetical protein
MRPLLGVGAVVLGVVGVLLCAAAVGLGWWLVEKSAGRVTRVAVRIDQGLSEMDAGFAQVEERIKAVRTDFDEVRGATARIPAGNPDLPGARTAIDQVLSRLAPALDLADAIGGSLRSTAGALRAADDLVDEVSEENELSGRFQSAADTIDRAAEALKGVRARLGVVKMANSVRLPRELGNLAREAVAGSERLADGLAAARKGIDIARGRTAERRILLLRWV